MTRTYKRQVISKLEKMGYDRTHTLRKTWEAVNGINRRGWFVATINGWKWLGDTLTHAMERLELEEDCYS